MKKVLRTLLIKRGLIPLYKSWLIRMAILDLRFGKDTITDFLRSLPHLSGDLEALLQASISWLIGEKEIYVGESGTLYRFMSFLSWVENEEKEFVLTGTLRHRKITQDPAIVSYPISRLLTLDNKTSQWASAALLSGRSDRSAWLWCQDSLYRLVAGFTKSIPYKLSLTYDAVRHWKEQREMELPWEPRYDDTILRQAEAFVRCLNGESFDFIPHQPEDYCLARAFGLMNADEGLRKWPSLVGHESNRIVEMELELRAASQGRSVQSLDHRVVQSIAMWAATKNITVEFKYPDCVNKSWPEFWKLMKFAKAHTL